MSRAPKPAAPQMPSEFVGVTATACCAACNAEKCVITGKPYCGHPFKAAVATIDRAVTDKVAQVRKIIAHQKVEAI